MRHPLTNETRERIIERDQTSSDDGLWKSLFLTLEAIRPYFTKEAWDKWIDAGPDSIREAISRAVTEYNNILCELFEDVPQAQ